MMQKTLAVAQFVAATAPQPLADDEIHLWFFPQWKPVADAAQSAPVRALLGAYLGGPAADVRIERGAHGKPHLLDARLQFNLAHAADTLLLGVSLNISLGVDIEAIERRVREPIALARRFFSPCESAALEALDDTARHAAFLRLWCAKEAALKAQGRGIGFGLDRIEFEIDSHGIVTPAHGNAWNVLAVAPAPGVIGALAYDQPVGRVRAFVTEN